MLWSDVYMCHWRFSNVTQHSITTRALLCLSPLSTCVSAEVDRLCLALRAHGLLFSFPVDLRLVTGPVFRWKPCRAPCCQVKCSCTSPLGLETEAKEAFLYSPFNVFLCSRPFCIAIIRFSLIEVQ